MLRLLYRYARVCLLLVGVGGLAGEVAAQTWTASRVEQARYQVGDDPRWASPVWVDTTWSSFWLSAPPDTQAVFWVRAQVHLGEVTAPPTQPPAIDVPGAVRTYGLFVAALAASELYWDGVLIGTRGQVGSSAADEQPGPIGDLVRLPDSLATAGVHTLALRLSNFHRPPSINYYIYGLSVVDYEAWSAETPSLMWPLFFLGGFVLIAVYYATLFVLDRRRTPYLFISLLCVTVSVLLLAERWRPLFGYTYEWHLPRLLVITGATCLLSALLPTLFALQFRFPWRRTAAALLGLGLLASLFMKSYDQKSEALFWCGLVASFIITSWAVYRRQEGSVLAWVGTAVCLGALLVFDWSFMDRYFFPAFAVLVGCLLISLGLHTRAWQRQHEAALLTAARLEIELLRKQLQPHFLLNTLTSVIEWMEAHPQTAVRFIEALADELRMLAAISSKTMIPMAEELALSRAHLRVMGYRKDQTYTLATKGIEETALVPPALIHTLVENGVTHNRYYSPTVRFTLVEERDEQLRRYRFTTPPPSESAGLQGDGYARAGAGTGLRYVQARLEESFTGRWTLRSEPVSGGWQTVIEIRPAP
ncbi:MAG: histidine kinase [Bacteroidota bacterium]